MDFTREPIIETVVTPRTGCKLVVRNSKGIGQEEYFVDALEVVSFGTSLFFRSQERPKSFLLPATDYEVLEVREARMILKHAGASERPVSKPIVIKETAPARAPAREVVEEEAEPAEMESEAVEAMPAAEAAPVAAERTDSRKRERRRHPRRRRGREEGASKEAVVAVAESPVEGGEEDSGIRRDTTAEEENGAVTPSILSTLLPPPPTLISETIHRYRQDETFKGAFFRTEEEGLLANEELGSPEKLPETEQELTEAFLDERERQRQFAVNQMQAEDDPSLSCQPEEESLPPT